MTLARRTGEQALALFIFFDSFLLGTLVVVPAWLGTVVVKTLLLRHDGLLPFLEKIESFSLFTKEILFYQHHLKLGAEKLNEKAGLLSQTVVTIDYF